MAVTRDMKLQSACIPMVNRFSVGRTVMEAWKAMSYLVVAFCLLFAPLNLSSVSAQTSIGPTTSNALAADQALARAIRENDANGILRWLDSSWAVISTAGGIGEGPSIFPEGIKSGGLARKTFESSEPRVRLYGKTALITTIINTSGTLQGKAFNVMERQTDVWLWRDGGWKCVLTHETKIKNN
jgi:ketosteroid isomerase-like protein